MKLGLLSAILADQNFHQVIDICSEVGFAAVEAACWPKGLATRRYAGVTHLDFDDRNLGEVESQLQYARDKNILVSAFCYYPNPLSDNDEQREEAVNHIKKLIKAAGRTGIGMVNTFIGRNKFKSVEENLELYQKTWSPIIDLAEKENVRIAIENCPMLFTKDEWPGGNNLAASPAIWDEMFRLIDSDKLGLNYDPSHFVILDMDYIKPLQRYKDKIFHIHLKDTYIDRDKLNMVGRTAYPLSYMTPKLPGLGDIDWAAFCGALYGVGYEGCACVEVEDRAFEIDEKTIRKGIEISYKNVFGYF